MASDLEKSHGIDMTFNIVAELCTLSDSCKHIFINTCYVFWVLELKDSDI